MSSIKLVGLATLFAVLLAQSAQNAKQAVSGGDYESIKDLKEGEVWCPSKKVHNETEEVIGTKCDEGSFAHHYECGGKDNGECRFALQLWVYIVIGVIVLISLFSTIAGIVCRCFCCK
ncbi:unnamed protein product [Caenorhabditis sp. 36 PRJEB53466]|nr:unnamed protein product [Caenorhabditis sp. 36 PRJEB53466]